jgi:hypothetical protein
MAALFAVKQIVNIRRIQGRVEFQVEWEPSWVREGRIRACRVLVSFLDSFEMSGVNMPLPKEYSAWDHYVSKYCCHCVEGFVVLQVF